MSKRVKNILCTEALCQYQADADKCQNTQFSFIGLGSDSDNEQWWNDIMFWFHMLYLKLIYAHVLSEDIFYNVDYGG